METRAENTPEEQKIIGFVLNPVAGMGGRVGLKGTDDVVDQARRMGASENAHHRAAETLRLLQQMTSADAAKPACRWETCAADMGENVLRDAGIEPVAVVYDGNMPSDAEDTRAACRVFEEHGVSLILFCGGDGTARDISQVVGSRVPILGIPAGVKMYSGVFAATPRHAAHIIHGYLRGESRTTEAEVLDLDEEKYRQGEWSVRLFTTARVPLEPRYVQPGKSMIDGATETGAKAEIAAYLADLMERAPDALWILGAGTTTRAIADHLDIHKSLLGIDAVKSGQVVGRDLNEDALLALLKTHPDARLVLSPIGAQGFVIGRGNSPLSAAVIRAVGTGNLMIVATPGKLRETAVLRFDTGDRSLDEELSKRGYLPVVVGDERTRMVAVLD